MNNTKKKRLVSLASFPEEYPRSRKRERDEKKMEDFLKKYERTAKRVCFSQRQTYCLSTRNKQLDNCVRDVLDVFNINLNLMQEVFGFKG